MVSYTSQDSFHIISYFGLVDSRGGVHYDQVVDLAIKQTGQLRQPNTLSPAAQVKLHAICLLLTIHVY